MAAQQDPLAKLIQDEVDQTKKTETQETGSPGPIKVRVGNNVYTFNNPDELSAAINQTIETYNAHIAELQKAAATAAEQAKQGAETKGPGSYVAEDEPPPFSKEKYVELLRNDPVAAQDYLDSYRLFGGYIEKPSVVIGNILAKVAQQERILAAYQFREAHPEFPGGEVAANTLEAIRKENNLPFTFAGLEAALGIAQSRGLLPTREQYLSFIQQRTAAAQALPGQEPTRPQGPPALGRTTAEVSPDLERMAEELTPEQIEKIFARLQGTK